MKNKNKTAEFTKEKEWYRKKIIEMINHINNENYLLKIYSFVKVFFED